MRSMHALKFVGIVVMASVSALLDNPASAESEAFCREYAQKAVNAFHQKTSLKCFPEGAPQRWQANFNNHFNWCRGAPAIWPRREEEMRQNQLRVCRGEPKAVGCREYAIHASSAHRTNLSARCGFTGPRWQDNFENWPVPGSEDTELGVLMEPEVGHGETEVYPRVQA